MLLTCGTTFGDANAVASMVCSPVPESMLINSALASVGTVPELVADESTIRNLKCYKPSIAEYFRELAIQSDVLPKSRPV